MKSKERLKMKNDIRKTFLPCLNSRQSVPNGTTSKRRCATATERDRYMYVRTMGKNVGTRYRSCFWTIMPAKTGFADTRTVGGH